MEIASMMTYGQQILIARREKNLRQEDVANTSGYSEGFIRGWERGEAEPARNDFERVMQAIESLPARPRRGANVLTEAVA